MSLDIPPDWTPSRCPVLDLGWRLPVGDKRDPWRRMPRMFQVCRSVFGSAFMSRHDPDCRLEVEKRVAHYCAVTRETHGMCSRKRMILCHTELHRVVQQGAFAPEGKRRALALAGITGLLRSNRHQGELKATRVSIAPAVRMPPVALRGIPDDRAA